jgi:transposase InsO family protein
MAVAMRGELAETVMVHADRGCQYTSAQLARFARGHNLTRSVGRIGVVLRKRCRRIILGDSKSRVLRPIPGPHPHRP